MNVEPEPWVEFCDATIYRYNMLCVMNETHAQWDWVHTVVLEEHTMVESNPMPMLMPTNSVYKLDATLPLDQPLIMF
jgi:hypothetical protein